MRKNNFLPLILLTLTSSCGFHLASSMQPEKAKTVSIPYVEGDSDGQLTAAIIEAVEKQGGLRYTKGEGRFTLKVKQVDSSIENIGFRFDPKHPHHKSLIPSESRNKNLIEVSLIDNASQKTVVGPAYLLVKTDYDHQNYSIDQDNNRFSLGQLSDIDTSSDVLSIPVHRNIARDVAQYLQHHLHTIN